MRRALASSALILLLAAGPASGQRAQDETGELGRLQAEHRDEQVRARRLRADAAEAAAEIATLEGQLAALRHAVGVEDVQVTAQRARLKALGDREATLIAALSHERGRQGRLLSALQMMSRDPPPPLLIPAGHAVDTARAGILMRAMAPELERRARVLAARQDAIIRVRRLAALSSERLFTLESARTDRRAEIEALTARKTALGVVLKAEAEQADRAARTLEARIRSLGGAIRPIGDEAPSTVARLPGGRSRLNPPVPGAPLARFGRGTSGWRWRASGETVVAPADATVDYAGPLSGWGEVVILNLGPGWRVVVAGLGRTAVAAGDRVADGAPLGEAGSDPDAEVYFELRRDERPVDPAPWLD